MAGEKSKLMIIGTQKLSNQKLSEPMQFNVWRMKENTREIIKSKIQSRYISLFLSYSSIRTNDHKDKLYIFKAVK